MSVEWTYEDSFPEEERTYTPPVQEYVPTSAPSHTPEPTTVTGTYSDDVGNVVNDVNYVEEDETTEQQPSEEATPPQENSDSTEVPRFKEGLISKFISFIKSFF